MNERIQTLALECGAWQQVYDQQRFMHNYNFDIEKFAELIVKECAGLFPNVYVEIENEYGHTPVIAADYIKKHFGVEE